MDIPKINTRIREIIDFYCNGSVKKFAEECGISQQTLNRLFNIDTRTHKYPTATTEIIVAIIEMFVDVDSTWLLTGKGKMVDTENASPKCKSKMQVQKQDNASPNAIPIKNEEPDWSDAKFNADFSATTTNKPSQECQACIEKDNTIVALWELIKAKSEIIKAKDEVIASKDEIIKSKNEQIDDLIEKRDDDFDLDDMPASSAS